MQSIVFSSIQACCPTFPLFYLHNEQFSVRYLNLQLVFVVIVIIAIALRIAGKIFICLKSRFAFKWLIHMWQPQGIALVAFQSNFLLLSSLPVALKWLIHTCGNQILLH